MKITFDVLKQTTKIAGTCGICGKKRSKTLVVEQTVNPYNRNEDGTPKSRNEVWIAVRKELVGLAKKSREHFICATCFNNLPWPKKWQKI